MWYVFALVDAAPRGRLGRGLGGPLRAREVPGGFAIVERRADVPPLEFGPLRAHQQVVTRLARAVPAILPIRFGTLLDEDALDEVLAERGGDVTEAFALVRERVQFTWRRATGNKADHERGSMRIRAYPSEAGPDQSGAQPAAGAGAAYLRRAAGSVAAAAPGAFRLLGKTLHPFVVREKFQAAANGMPDTLYHLVESTAARRYRVRARALTRATPAMTLSGPWPPFAFAAELL